MSTTKILNVRVPQQVFMQLEELTKLTDRSKSYLTINALQTMINEQAWQLQDIHTAL